MKDATNIALALDASPDEFFFELVRSAVHNQKIKIQPETEFYIVKLLNRFIFSESLYSKKSDGTLEDQPLVFLYKEAVEAEDTHAKKSLFQNVGDISLYKAGFFQENLTRFKIDLNYFINLGGAAYQNAADRSEDRNFKEMFSELSHKFGTFVDVLSEVSEQTTAPSSEQDLFKLYDMWSRTGSGRAARALKKAGIKVSGE
jgi:hypothetical protein